MFAESLKKWYSKNKRVLPWRKTKTPYYIWLSEIMLQQTRVAQGLPYFLKFSEAFPSVFDLAKADEGYVLKLWQGLGYYSRARNLHFTAKFIADELNGEFPKDYKGLLKLKGVGDYTASAIASICYNEPVAVVDGNVYRVLSRYFGIAMPINSTKGVKEFKELAQSLIDQRDPGMYNQAIMDFGAMQCKPKSPDCTSCPLSESCVALEKNLVDTLPVKEKKIKIKHRYFNYLVVISDKQTVIHERVGKGIWQGLFEFPLIETQKSIEIEELVNDEKFITLFSNEVNIKLHNNENIIHKLSHQHLHTKFWVIETNSIKGKSISWKEIMSYPVPVLIHNFLKEFKVEID
ncbi:A/G-specific adenine glycosylase [Tenacibaculum agarivorans]|uniref:A/G-specific adenine glycosylase n=1 Tax=Tenacibaculum agarivorans TaxID=1908389 RepID=UPI00094B994C|nr:A/G-specific adenine glycosylase [Tenacibaculum agarivorans]